MSSGAIVALTGVLIAASCALCGVFLVLRRMAMMADAVTHAVLPGLVGAYVFANGPNLLAGLVGAAAAGLLTVWLVEVLTRSRGLKEDSAIGLVFPAMFAIGVVVVSKWYSGEHIDTDSILFGQLEFSWLDHFMFQGRDLGPTSFWMGGGLLLLNAVFLAVFYKELKITTFDPQEAECLGIKPRPMHYALMAVVAMTAVGAFSAVGAVLSVALIVIPAAAALLLTSRLPIAILGSVGIAAIGSLGGHASALEFDVSIAGMITVVLGAIFLLAALISPRKGLVAQAFRRRTQARRFAAEMLVVHLLTHEGTAEEPIESAYGHLIDELEWPPKYAALAAREARVRGAILMVGENFRLTPSGREWARDLAEQKRFMPA